MPRRRSDPGFGSGPPKYPGTFLLAFREALADLNWKIARYLGNRIECLDDKEGVQVVGLENLYRQARHAPREEWPGLITNFLRQGILPGLPEEQPKLTDVVDQLLPRLGKPMRSVPDEARIWSQPLEGTDLVVNLVVDYPSRMIYVTEKQVDESGRAGAEWLERALDNLREQTEEDCFQIIHEESGLRACSVADHYDSSRALLLDVLLPEEGEDGHFVGLPNRDQLLVLPVAPPALAFLFLMKLIVDKEYQSEPYPISNDVFWVHDGLWRRFTISVQGEQITLLPPPEFGPIFERLVKDAEEEGEEPAGSEGA